MLRCTLGGYSVGKIVEHPRVLGAVSDRKMLEVLKTADVVFPKGEPGGGIVGSSFWPITSLMRSTPSLASEYIST